MQAKSSISAETNNIARIRRNFRLIKDNIKHNGSFESIIAVDCNFTLIRARSDVIKSMDDDDFMIAQLRPSGRPTIPPANPSNVSQICFLAVAR